MPPLDNKVIANVFYEVADLLEIDNADSFRIRSYRRAAEAVEGWPQQVAELASDPKKLLEIPGIGKGMGIGNRGGWRGGTLMPPGCRPPYCVVGALLSMPTA